MTSGRLLTRPFVLGFAANFMHALALHSYLHLPGFLEALGADELRIGLVMATMSMAAIFSRPLIGRLIDSRGRRVVLVAGSVVNVAASLAYLSVDAIGPWIYGVRMVHGLAQAMLFSVLFTIAADIVPAKRRTEGLALFGVSGMLPLSLAGLVGDWILAAGTYRDLFAFTAAAAVLGLLVGLPLPDSRPPDEEHEGPARSFVRAIWTPALRPVWLVGFSFAFALSSYFTFLKTYVLERQIGSVGSFFTAYTIAAVALRVGLGWVPDRVGPRRTLFPAVACVAAGVVVLATASTSTHVIIAGVLCGIGHGYAFPIASVLAVVRARASERGAALAAFTALFDLGILVGGPTLGLLASTTDYETMFLTAGALAMTGLFVFAWWDRGHDLQGNPR